MTWKHIELLGILSIICFCGVMSQATFRLETTENVHVGDEIKMICEANHDSTVQLYKKQAKSPEVIFAMNAQIFRTEPDYKDRMTLQEETIGEKKQFVLTIGSAKYIDSGKYTCTKIGVNPTAEDWKTVTVVKPIKTLELLSQTNQGEGGTRLTDGQTLTVTEDKSYFLMCRALGSSPAPEVKITFDGNDITHLFTVTDPEIKAEPSKNENAMSDITYTVVAIGKQFLTVPKDSSRKELTCSASVPTEDVRTLTIRPVLESAPIIKCDEETIAYVGQEKAEIKCSMEAEPAPNLNEDVHIMWKTGSEGETAMLTPDHEHEHYSFQVKEKDAGLWDVTLVVKNVNEEDFRAYDLMAKNKHGAGNNTIVLKRGSKEDVDDVAGHGNNLIVSAILTTIFVGLVKLITNL